jgi:hypothetical protein
MVVCNQGTRAASRRDSELPRVLALEHVSGIPERSGEAVWGQLRVLGEKLLLRCPARGELEQKLDAETCAVDARFPPENLRI